MKKNIYLFIVGVLILGLAIGLPFTFGSWNDSLTAVQGSFIVYIVAKCIFGLFFIGVLAWSLIKERARGTVYIFLGAATIAQLVPLLIRVSVNFKGFEVGFGVIAVVLACILLTALTGLVVVTNKKQVASDVKYQGNEIEVVDEKISENKHKEVK